MEKKSIKQAIRSNVKERTIYDDGSGSSSSEQQRGDKRIP
jgi:hypothetical protein